MTSVMHIVPLGTAAPVLAVPMFVWWCWAMGSKRRSAPLRRRSK